MFNKFLKLAVVGSVAVIAGCGGGGAPANSSGNNAATNINSNAVSPVAVNLDPANLPPGLSASPIQQPANIPGVNAKAVQPKGGTPTPGIPSAAEIKKFQKPGTTPTPGIPSPEEIQRMLGRPATNANASVPQMKGSSPTIMKSNRPTGGKIKP